MAEGDGILYKRFKEALMESVDFGSEKDTFKITLYTHSRYDDSIDALIENPFTHESVIITEVLYGEEGS